jgi:hypothetical protein
MMSNLDIMSLNYNESCWLYIWTKRRQIMNKPELQLSVAQSACYYVFNITENTH